MVVFGLFLNSIPNCVFLVVLFSVDHVTYCGRAFATALRLSSSVCTEYVVAKRFILEQKLLLTAYKKLHMRNRLVPKWMTLTFVYRSFKSCEPLRDIWHWTSRKPFKIDAWFQRTTNRKWPTWNRMAMWPMTSHDPERSNLWPQYA